MAKRYRVGVIGVAHMHVNELMRRFHEIPNVEMTAIADTPPEFPEINVTSASSRAHTINTAMTELGFQKQYSDYRELLEKEKLDIVINNSENNRHGDVVEACAQRGIHVMVEKPMAATLYEALRMVRAAERYGTRLAVNWPSTWSGGIRTMKRLLDEGAIGRLWQVHARYGSLGPLSAGSTHPGVKAPTAMFTDEEKGVTWWHRADNGGGALLDYCCYGANLSRWFFGVPAQAAFGMKLNANSHYGSSDDNAVLTVRFPTGMAVLEASWSTVDHMMPTGPILYGTEGTMRLQQDVGNREAGVEIVRGKGKAPELIPGDDFPATRDTLGKEFMHHIETGEPLHETMDPYFNLDAMAILDAGIRSAESAKLETVDSIYWRASKPAVRG